MLVSRRQASAFFGAFSLAVSGGAFAASPPPEAAQALGAMLRDHKAGTPTIAGEALTVLTPTWTWSEAVGTVAGKSEALSTRHSFRIASVTKSFTAATVLRLMEMGKIDISAPVTGYISEDSAALLKSGGYDPSAITVEQLLSHTSGLYDYAMDDTYSAKVFADPMHQWTRAEQIKHAMKYGKPVGKPGENYAYSDTGYILLGEIIERLTGQSLATAVRTLLRFQKLGLKDTYWEQLEPKPRASTTPFAGNLFEGIDLTKSNASYDLFGGGGMISTIGDLATFMRALIRGEVFDDRRTLATLLMIAPAKRAPGGHDTYGNGVYQFNIGRMNCMGHGGFWGQAVAYCPSSDITFAWTINHGGTLNPKIIWQDQLARALGKN